MIAVVVSLVAVVLLVLVVVALGMRSMSRRESSLPPERLKEMAEKEERTQTRSTDEFASHEPRMANFSPDFSPIGEREPKPVRTGQRGRRGVDEWGNPSTDDDDEEFWANIRSDAEEGGFGAGGTVAARKGASRPVEREKPAAAERPTPPKRQERTAKPRPVAASAAVDPDATTIQAPLPQRQPASAAANLADLVEPAKRPAPSRPEPVDQRTVTFAAPTADVMSILSPGAQPVPSPRPDSISSNNSPRGGTGSYPAAPAAGGTFPANPLSQPNGSGAYPATPASSGSFPAQPAPIHGAPTSDPFPAYTNAAETTWTNPPATPSSSGSWPAQPDILDDPTPAAGYGSSWPAFEQPAARSSYPASYEVRSGWAVADDSEPLTGPTPASSTPTVPGRAVSAYDDVLSTSTPVPPTPPGAPFAYETGDITTAPAAAWPEPPSSATAWPTYGSQNGNNAGNHRRSSEQEHPHDYYR
ncbi:hypothetical protein ACIBQ1_43485 [Nonomuraea sp. NPDC050153]|uniref:hypothetical protein n=1 Tax=Nonomuraea sp. NPDC050153 TaxID=3364359 RepID=UPI003792E3C2